MTRCAEQEATLYFLILFFVSACGNSSHNSVVVSETNSDNKSVNLSNYKSKNQDPLREGSKKKEVEVRRATLVEEETDNAEILSLPEVDPNSETLKTRELKISQQAALSTCARGSFPDLLPYKKGRIDVFMRYSAKNIINREFLVLSLDGHVKSIGLVSSGASGTPAGRYYFYGLHRDKRQIDPDTMQPAAYMPYNFMLTGQRPKYWGEKKDRRSFENPVQAVYKKYNFHGTDSYGTGSFGHPASHGCIRHYTDHSGKKASLLLEQDFKGNVLNKNDPLRLKRYGLHRINWKYLNPFDWDTIDLQPNKNQSRFGQSTWEGNWFSDRPTPEGNFNVKNGGQIGMEEMSKKIRIELHDSKTLSSDPERREILEKIYTPAVSVLKKAIYKGKAGYIDFGLKNNLNGYELESEDFNMQLDTDLLKQLEEIEALEEN